VIFSFCFHFSHMLLALVYLMQSIKCFKCTCSILKMRERDQPTKFLFLPKSNCSSFFLIKNFLSLKWFIKKKSCLIQTLLLWSLCRWSEGWLALGIKCTGLEQDSSLFVHKRRVFWVPLGCDIYLHFFVFHYSSFVLIILSCILWSMP
jgi:hypothetical protein